VKSRATELSERFRHELIVRRYSPRTQKAYTRHIDDFLRFARSPSSLEDALTAYVLERTTRTPMSRSYHDQMLRALRLFCRRVLGRPIDQLPLDRPRPRAASPERAQSGGDRQDSVSARSYAFAPRTSTSSEGSFT
jgi:hypothetical protein